jgi:hypothetical protein
MGVQQLSTTTERRLFVLVLQAQLAIGLALSTGVVFGQNFVPFVIPARIDPKYPIWISEYESISPNSARIVVQNAHFARGEKSVRIWGVNLSFAANFPTHQDAEAVATRLAAAGVNSIRCHHMDTSAWPNGIWNPQDRRTLAPEALDRLDYFINELAKRGIFANINLHVGRAHSEYLNLPKPNREYDKIVGIFTPTLIDAQKKYARDLLTHVNPYRKTRYADDAAVAFVEISNEDSLFMWDADETLRTLPPYYAQILREKFNTWLQKRHGSDEAVRSAWAKDTQPLGENMLKNSDFASWDSGRGVPSSWNLEQHEGCQAKLSKPQTTQMRVEITKADATDWHLQLNQGGITLKQGQYYTVSFEAAGDQPRQIVCTVGQAHEPWSNLGLSHSIELTRESKRSSFGFVATADDNDARVSFAFSGSPTPFALAHVELCSGGQVGLAGGESMNNKTIALFQENESQQRILDRLIFLAETEKAYFDDMRSYIKKDLGCGALVTGTVVFGPLGQYAQSDMDYIDSHAYWQHPRFPNKPWDPADWYIEQKAMTDYLKGATLFELAAERLAGKPFTVSEYNHPAPLDAQAECVPMIASFAAAQGWDGVWLYTYRHTNDNWSREYLNSYFDIDTNPAKWGFMRAGAAILLENRVPELRRSAGVRIVGPNDVLSKTAHLQLQNGRDMLRVLGQAWNGTITLNSMLQRVYLPSYVYKADISFATSHMPDTETTWSAGEDNHGLYQITGPQVKVYTGHADRLEKETGGNLRISSPEFVALTVTPLDKGNWAPLDEGKWSLQGASQRVLITACGRCENTGMKFSEDRRTVGRNWGEAPVRIEAVSGRMVLPAGRWMVHALAPDGSPRSAVPITYENEVGTIVFSPKYETMWYLLERQQP